MNPISATTARAAARIPGRHLRLIVAMLCATTALSLAASSAGAAEVHTGRCDTAAHRFALGHRVSHLQTVVKTRRVWILHTAKDFGDEFFACWRPTGRARRIGFTSGGAAVVDTVLDSFVVSGRYVAFHISAGGDERYDRFRSFDVEALRARRDTGKVSAPAARTPTALVVTSTGAVAWLATGILHATDAAGTRVLADPASGPITDLAATGATASWTQAGQRRTATLR
ncbi:MAG: hypothetical protein QOJ35_977 [Solirubrobacteraceae bacterium]|nr:hypothetical protein [Solirubrobacteraceae bacterium]